MSKVYNVKGVNPLGRIVEVMIVADTAKGARAQAEDVGLKFVVVREVKSGKLILPPPEAPSNEGEAGKRGRSE